MSTALWFTVFVDANDDDDGNNDEEHGVDKGDSAAFSSDF